MNGLFRQMAQRLVGSRSFVPEDEFGRPLCMFVHKGSSLLLVPNRQCRKPAVALYHHKKSEQTLSCCPMHDYSRAHAPWELIEAAYTREVVDANLDAQLARDYGR